MKKKGFTLVELLAVIVILAVIALIAVPQIMKTIEQSRKDSFKQSVNNMVRQAKLKYIADDKPESKLYSFDELNLSGKKINGQVLIQGKKISYSLNDGKYQTIKTEYSDEVFENIIDGETPLASSIFNYPELNEVFDLNDNDDGYNYYIEVPLADNEEEKVKFLIYNGDLSTLRRIENTDVNFNGSNLVFPKYVKSPNGEIVQITKITNPFESVSNLNFTDGILNIKVPQGIEEIRRAFEDMELNDVVIANDIKDMEYAFETTKITGLIVLGGIEEVSENSFYYSNINSIILGNGLKKISPYAFFQSKINNISLPNSLEEIGQYAFSSTDLKEITIPGNVTTIEEGLFSNSNLEKLFLQSGTKYIRSSAFFDCDLKELVLPNSVEELGNSTFLANNLESVIFSSNLKKIDTACFIGNKLKKVQLPESIEELGNAVFLDNKIVEVYLPNSLTNLPSGTFQNQEKALKKISMKTGTKCSGSDVFAGCIDADDNTIMEFR